MSIEKMIQSARHSPSGLPPEHVLQSLRSRKDDTLERRAQLGLLRAQLFEQLRDTLSLKDRPLLRFLLVEEMHDRTEDENIYIACFLLFLLGQLEDVELLWQTKRSDWDVSFGFDVQFLVGAGTALTLTHLQSLGKEWATEARKYIEANQDQYDLDDLEEYRHWKWGYFWPNISLREPGLSA
jgi:hypothetical protein